LNQNPEFKSTIVPTEVSISNSESFIELLFVLFFIWPTNHHFIYYYHLLYVLIGYFLWVEFSNISSAEIFAGYCLDRGLKFMPGMRCDSVLEGFEESGQPKELCQHSARLCFADMELKDVSDGAKLLVKLYREYTGKL
jgi:hypothetical protein